MVQLRSVLTPADNSGAKAFAIIGVPGRYGKKATLGQVVKAVVKGVRKWDALMEVISVLMTMPV